MSEPSRSLRVLFVGDGGVSSGFARCTHAVCNELHRAGHSPHVLAINWYGDSHPYPYPLYHCMQPFDGGTDGLGTTRLPVLIDRLAPDVVVLLTDPWQVPGYLACVRAYFVDCLDRVPPIVAWLAVDAENVKAGPLNDPLLTHVAVWTRFAADTLRAGGYRGADLSVIPLGVDPTVFRPLDRAEARAATCPGLDLPPDAFLVGYVGRNQYRKRVDLMIAGFAEWLRNGGPSSARLLLYVAPTGDGNGCDIRSLAAYYGVTHEVLLAEPAIGHGNPESYLAQVYNSLDAFLVVGPEGWCLPVLEAMACGVPCVVPDFAALGFEGGWPGHAAVRLHCPTPMLVAPYGSATGFYTVGRVPEPSSLVAPLQNLYASAEYRDEVRRAGLRRAAELPWQRTGVAFREMLEEIVDGLHESQHAADEVTAPQEPQESQGPLATATPYPPCTCGCCYDHHRSRGMQSCWTCACRSYVPAASESAPLPPVREVES